MRRRKIKKRIRRRRRCERRDGGMVVEEEKENRQSIEGKVREGGGIREARGGKEGDDSGDK